MLPVAEAGKTLPSEDALVAEGEGEVLGDGPQAASSKKLVPVKVTRLSERNPAKDMNMLIPSKRRNMDSNKNYF